MTATIERLDLVHIVDEATRDLTESTRQKMLAAALATDAVAVGWWHCDGVRCLAEQARRKNQTFQERFDRAMAARFGRPVREDERLPVEPFAVQVIAPTAGALQNSDGSPS